MTLLLLMAGAPVAGPASGNQGSEPASTTLPSSTSVPFTTTTTGPGEGEPPTSRVEEAGGPQGLLPGLVAGKDEGSGEDVPPDVLPDPSLTVPPPAEPATPTPEQQQLLAAMAARFEQSRLSLMVALGLEAQALAGVTAAEADVAAARTKLSSIQQDERDAVSALDRQRARVRRWAVQAYAGGSLRRVAYVLESEDINDVPRRLGLAGGVFGGLEEDLGEQEAALQAVVAEHRASATALAAGEERLATARHVAAEAGAQVASRREEVAALDAGQAVSIGGVAFPIPAPNRFTDTFGAPRMGGSRYAHAHQGVDIFAAPGAPVVAFERGVVTKLGTDVLGGTKLWLVGQSATRYYYAHLQAYVPDLKEGQVVEVGQTLAFVGNTGNARNSQHHLHFEIHPGGGMAVNPSPVLVQILEAARVGAALQATAERAPAASVPPPG